MVPRYNISLAEERDLALRRLQRICDNKFISVLDFWNNPLRIFAAHELAAIIDPAMTTKMTVQVRFAVIQYAVSVPLYRMIISNQYFLLLVYSSIYLVERF